MQFSCWIFGRGFAGYQAFVTNRNPSNVTAARVKPALPKIWRPLNMDAALQARQFRRRIFGRSFAVCQTFITNRNPSNVKTVVVKSASPRTTRPGCMRRGYSSKQKHVNQQQATADETKTLFDPKVQQTATVASGRWHYSFRPRVRRAQCKSSLFSEDGLSS
jgi:hypothetical protein